MLCSCLGKKQGSEIKSRGCQETTPIGSPQAADITVQLLPDTFNHVRGSTFRQARSTGNVPKVLTVKGREREKKTILSD